MPQNLDFIMVNLSQIINILFLIKIFHYEKKGFYIVKGIKYLIKGDKENLEVYSGLKFENLKSSFSHDVHLIS